MICGRACGLKVGNHARQGAMAGVCSGEEAFDTALRRRAFPPTPAVCYRAPWRLPGTGLPQAHGLRDHVAVALPAD